jgi:hypothetical protein
VRRTRNAYKILVSTSEGKSAGDMGIGRRMVLEWILIEQNVCGLYSSGSGSESLCIFKDD